MAGRRTGEPRGKSRRRSGETPPGGEALPEEISPERYVEKVSLATGEPLDEPIRPHQLLVHHHRDYHLVDIHARYMMSRVVRATGREAEARRRMKQMRRLGFRTSRILARMLGNRDPEEVSRALFGLKDREYFFRYKRQPHSRSEVREVVTRLKSEAEAKLDARAVHGRQALRVLLTGGTGFVGKEILWQAAHDDEIAELVVLIRPREIRDRTTGELLEVVPPARRGEDLLRQLWLDSPEQRSRFRFIAGDIERPGLGIEPEERAVLERTLTHVIHCAASVAFDDPYEASFRANVLGTLNALRFSHSLQTAESSPFVAHLAIETSYIHGRQTRDVAREDEIVFPRNFYNNYYELTKAMASLETERFMLDKGLRVVQLCPAIVIGEARAGNNRGDTKVVNAPINLFGRAALAGEAPQKSWIERSKATMLARLALIFPGDPSAQINLIPVDRVVAGILAALKRPRAVGERVHLATDRRITSEKMAEIIREEVGARVQLADPTLHRTVTLPLLTKVLARLKQGNTARILEKLGTIFAGYSEWGQPIHEVGNDVRLLDLNEERPDAERCFRMLCRHNRYVQEWGRVKDPDEISRRERIWLDFIERIEQRAGKAAGAIPADEFHRLARDQLDFERKKVEPEVRAASEAEPEPA